MKTLVSLLVTIGFLSCEISAQGSQLVYPPISVSAAVRSVAGFASADAFGGVCKDAQGNHWTSCRLNGRAVLLRLSQSGQVTAATSTNQLIYGIDMTYDRLRNRVWVIGFTGVYQYPVYGVETYDALTGSLLWSYSDASTNETRMLFSKGIAWDGSGRILIAGSNKHLDAATLSLVTGNGAGTPAGTRGLIYLPHLGTYWTGELGYADGQNPVTECYFREYGSSGSSTMVPELSFGNANNTIRGGTPAGMDAWQDPSAGEWLGVFLQSNDAGDATMSTLRLSSALANGCGPVFGSGPVAMQNQIFAAGEQVGLLSWLIVGLQPGSMIDPVFGPGCTLHVNPGTATALGAFVSVASGSLVVGRASIPLNTSFREVPLWFQWATLDFGGNVKLSESRSAAIKQY